MKNLKEEFSEIEKSDFFQEIIGIMITLGKPSSIFKPKVTFLDGAWNAVYGDVIGFGTTPERACQDFDRMWRSRQ